MPKIKYLDGPYKAQQKARPPERASTPARKDPDRKDRINHLDQTLVQAYGVVLNLAEVTKALGYTRSDRVRKWLDDTGLRPVSINGRDVWLSLDIATALIDGAGRG